MKKKTKVILLGIVLLGMDYAFTGPISSAFFRLSLNTTFGSKEVTTKISDFKEPLVQFIDPEIPEDEFVHKLSIHIDGEVNQKVLINRFYHLEGTIDTVLQMDFYQNTDSLRIEAPVNTNGELMFTYKFYFSK